MFYIDKLFFDFYNYSEIEKLAPVTLEVTSSYHKNIEILNYKCECRGCTGHYAKLELKHYIYNPLLIHNIYTVFMNMCLNCFSISKNKSCLNCKKNMPSNVALSTMVVKNKVYPIVVSYNNIKVPYSFDEVYLILSTHKSNIELILGYEFCIEKFILKYILVIPPCVRICSVEETEYVDDITSEYAFLMISLSNNYDPDNSRNYIYKRYLHLLGIEESSKILLKQRLNGKSGYFRKLCLGKRTNYCCRSVISPNVDLDIDCVGIPTKLIEDLNVKEDDYVIVNRQPTLTKNSILFLRAKDIGPIISTIQLNPITVIPLNGDFDGDEVSVYNTQCIFEIENKLALKHNLIYNNQLIIGLDQNTLSGLYILSKYVNFSNMVNIPHDRIKRYYSSMYELKYDTLTLISSVLPEGFCYNEHDIFIDKGIFVSGIITKKNWWTSSNSVLQHLLFIYGPDEYLKYVKLMQSSVNEWLTYYGLTIGLLECLPYEEDVEYIKEQTNNLPLINYKLKSNKLKMESETRSLKNPKGLINIVRSGSKGDINNVGQIISCVGQQYINGNIASIDDVIHNSIPNTFISNSYTMGLNPDEIYLHSKMGREGLIRIAISTASIGYSGRTLIKFMEGLSIKDSQIIDFNENIISFALHEDYKCINTQKVDKENHELETMVKSLLYL